MPIDDVEVDADVLGGRDERSSNANNADPALARPSLRPTISLPCALFPFVGIVPAAGNVGIDSALITAAYKCRRSVLLGDIAPAADNSNEKERQNTMIKRVAELTNPAVILAAALGIILSPTVSMADPEARTNQHHTPVVRHQARRTVQFQGQLRSTPDRGDDAGGFYTPPRSPNVDDLLH